MIQFEELGPKRTFVLPELQERADGNPWNEGRQQYRLRQDGKEVAYLSFDVFAEGEITLYEIFVAKGYRSRGIGTAAVRFGVELGKKLEKKRLFVRPKPLDSTQTQKGLVGWYIRRGFTPSEDPEVLVMTLP